MGTTQQVVYFGDALWRFMKDLAISSETVARYDGDRSSCSHKRPSVTRVSVAVIHDALGDLRLQITVLTGFTKT